MTQLSGLNLLNGKMESVQLAKDSKGLVVVFLSANCPCSQSHESLLKEMSQKYPGFSFVTVHSNADESVELAKTHFAEAKLPFPVLQDEKSTLANQFHALKTPHAFVINQEGKILYQGGVTNSNNANQANKFFLKDALEDIQNNRAVKVAEGRTLGCVIAR